MILKKFLIFFLLLCLVLFIFLVADKKNEAKYTTHLQTTDKRPRLESAIAISPESEVVPQKRISGVAAASTESQFDSSHPEKVWLGSLKSAVFPGRLEVTTRDVVQDAELGRRTVFMQHSIFLLDTIYVPSFDKAEAHIILQLSTPLTDSAEKKLREFGVALLEYIPSNTWMDPV